MEKQQLLRLCGSKRIKKTLEKKGVMSCALVVALAAHQLISKAAAEAHTTHTRTPARYSPARSSLLFLPCVCALFSLSLSMCILCSSSLGVFCLFDRPLDGFPFTAATIFAAVPRKTTTPPRACIKGVMRTDNAIVRASWRQPLQMTILGFHAHFRIYFL